MNQESQRLKGFVMTCTENISTALLDGNPAHTNGGIQKNVSNMSHPTHTEVRVGAVPSRHNCKRCHRLRSLYPERLSTCFRLVNGFFDGSKLDFCPFRSC